MSDVTKTKDFWSRPEGTTGMVVAVVLGGAALLGLYTILPFLIKIAENTIYLGFLIAVVAVMLFIATNKDIHNRIWYAYKSIMKKITGIFVEMDPIVIMEVYIDYARGLVKTMEEQISQLAGQLEIVKNKINTNVHDMQNSLSKAKYANEHGKANVQILQVRQAGRLKNSNLTLQNLVDKVTDLYNKLSHIKDNTDLMVEDLANEVGERKSQRDIIYKAYKAMNAAAKLIMGDPKKDLFDQANEAMANDIGDKLGQIERFMQVSTKFVDGVDMENGIVEEDGMQLLEQWEKDPNSIFLTPGSSDTSFFQIGSQPERVQISNVTDVTDTNVNSAAVNDYSRLLNKK